MTHATNATEIETETGSGTHTQAHAHSVKTETATKIDIKFTLSERFCHTLQQFDPLEINIEWKL